MLKHIAKWTSIAALTITAVISSPAYAGNLSPQASSDATSASDEWKTALRHSVQANADRPAPKPGNISTADGVVETCTEIVQGRKACLRVLPSSGRKPAPHHGSSTQAVIPYPNWCTYQAMGTRTETCQIYTTSYTTIQIVNGQSRVSGELYLDIYSYPYSSASYHRFAHQIGVVAYWGWGDAMAATVSGSAYPQDESSCTRESMSFPPQPLQPLNTRRDGEAYFVTTATTPGAIAFCPTSWELTFRTPGYTNGSYTTTEYDIRSDNAAGANGFRPARVGCVVWWYASTVTYSRSAYPTLADHVARAQASGLPGATSAAPLTRTNDQAIIDRNRALACGDAPSIPDMSCDEYPLASTYQGLSAGGTRRTFDGCNINAPRQTGPSGASACMIRAGDNNAQGGIMAAFYYDWRVLHGDDFRVAVGP